MQPDGSCSEATSAPAALGSLVAQLTLCAVGTPVISSPTAHHTGLSSAGFSHAML